MTYTLKRSKGGIRAEKTYEFNIGGKTSRKSTARVQPKTVNRKVAKAVRSKATGRTAVKRKTATAIARPEMRIHTIRSEKRIPMPLGILFTSFACTVMFMYIIFNMVQISEQNREINVMKAELSLLTEKKKDRERDLEMKNDLRYIEQYAVDELGMVKSDQLARQYVNIENEDKIEIMADTEIDPSGYESGLMAMARSAGTKLSELWEYIS